MSNTGADQPARPCSLISAFVIHLLESIISRLATSKISNFYRGDWLEFHFVGNPKDRFFGVEAHISVSTQDFGICADPESFVRGGPNLIMFFFS